MFLRKMTLKNTGEGGVKYSIETRIYRNCNTSCGIFER